MIIMKDIKILGTGCSKCKTVMQLVEKIAKQHNYEGKIEKVEDIAEIISYGVMSTPAIVIDGKVAFVGGIPSEDEVNKWFNEQTSCCCGCCK